MKNNGTIVAVSQNGDALRSSVRDNLPARTGIVWARQKQVYHVVSMADEILGEACALLGSLSKQAGHGMFGEADKPPLPAGQLSAVLTEILDCIDLATEHLVALNFDIRSRVEDEEV